MEERDYSLDFLKFGATCLIVLHHYQQANGIQLPGINFYGGAFNFGWLVELFFLLSGFLIAKYIPKIRKGMSFGEFYLKRFLRLAPMMALSVLVYDLLFLIRLHIYTGEWKTSLTTIWSTLITSVGIQDGWVNRNPALNNPLWYVSVLLLCYAVFYFTTFLAARCGFTERWAHVFMILLGIGIQNYELDLPFLNFDASRGYTAFFLGVLLAPALRGKTTGWKSVLPSCALLAAFTFLISRRYGMITTQINFVMTFLYYPALLIVFSSWPVKCLLRGRWLGTLGRLSFDAYIWHICGIELLGIGQLAFGWQIWQERYPPMLVFLVLIFLWAAVSYYCLERPIARVTDRLAPRLVEKLKPESE